MQNFQQVLKRSCDSKPFFFFFLRLRNSDVGAGKLMDEQMAVAAEWAVPAKAISEADFPRLHPL